MNTDADKILAAIEPDYQQCPKCKKYIDIKNTSSISIWIDKNNVYTLSSCDKCNIYEEQLRALGSSCNQT